MVAALGLDLNLFNDPDGRISHEMLCTLWQEITRRSGDPYIGLRLPEFTQRESWYVFGYAVLNSPNLGRALERMVQYIPLLHMGVELAFVVEDKVARFTHAIPTSPVPVPTVLGQWAVANIVWSFRQATGVNWVPLQVKFQHPHPPDISAYRDFFRAPLEFDCSVDELVLDGELLQLPLLKADPGLDAILNRHVKELIARLPKSNTFVDSVHWAISEGFRCGDVGMEAIAKRLSYTPRTFQRKLKESGTSYTDLLDRMRHQLSVHYLQEAPIAISEIAFLLGFSESSAFHRAFKRWTGTSPSEFRLAQPSSSPNLGILTKE
ncbi:MULTISPECIES: AraC family transcriptional regulator [Nostocales]|uniref:AraC family transcriptional regulator n=2 Tax=Nostocales TaxID=1161 RepID=A0ABW8WXC9_9CYAN|nr:AraC family transcriptional regulator [Tolypothrix bouteillei]